MGNVRGVTQNELQRVVAGLESDLSFGLPTTEVTMTFVGRELLIQWGKLRHVDEKMMMPRVVDVDARRGNTHTL